MKMTLKISIHAPRERSDTLTIYKEKNIKLFQSTLLVRGATNKSINRFFEQQISIHAPRERSDPESFVRSLVFVDFNPRSS